MLKRLPRMLVSGLVVPFHVLRRSSAVSMRGQLVVFSSFLVRIFHGSTSVVDCFEDDLEHPFPVHDWNRREGVPSGDVHADSDSGKHGLIA